MCIEMQAMAAFPGPSPAILRGTLDNWDPALIDELASSRRKWRTLATCMPADPARETAVAPDDARQSAVPHAAS
jgi:hypothetical protein